MNNLPFPQANNPDKVITLLMLINKDNFSKNNLSNLMEIHPRQIDYYFNAVRFLELVDIDSLKRINFSPYGNKIRSLKFPENYLLFADYMLNFYKLKPLFLLEDDLIISKSLEKLGISQATIKRRISTIKNWKKWAITIIDKYGI